MDKNKAILNFQNSKKQPDNLKHEFLNNYNALMLETTKNVASKEFVLNVNNGTKK